MNEETALGLNEANKLATYIITKMKQEKKVCKTVLENPVTEREAMMATAIHQYEIVINEFESKITSDMIILKKVLRFLEGQSTRSEQGIKRDIEQHLQKKGAYLNYHEAMNLFMSFIVGAKKPEFWGKQNPVDIILELEKALNLIIKMDQPEGETNNG